MLAHIPRFSSLLCIAACVHSWRKGDSEKEHSPSSFLEDIHTLIFHWPELVIGMFLSSLVEELTFFSQIANSITWSPPWYVKIGDKSNLKKEVLSLNPGPSWQGGCQAGE